MPRTISIIGGGAAGLTAAYFLSEHFYVQIYEKEKKVGKKFLVAGKGGFNLTNSLTGTQLINKYSPKNIFKEAILNFDSTHTREWLAKLGIETFVGTSGRVFSAKKHKPYEVLKSLKRELKKRNVQINTNHKFNGFDKNGYPLIKYEDKEFTLKSDYYIFALGGASWPNTGSDGKWFKYFKGFGLELNNFQPSNCGVNIKWPKNILNHHVGKPLKNISTRIYRKKYRGEAVITNYGLEGNAIYSVIPELRTVNNYDDVYLTIDFKPNNEQYNLFEKIKNKKVSSESYKKNLKLNSTQLAVLKSFINKDDFILPNIFTEKIKNLKLKIESIRPIEEAISTIGGISVSELNPDFSLKKYPKFYIIGEMADWDAPTGGFLLQGCFSMGFTAAVSIKNDIKKYH